MTGPRPAPEAEAGTSPAPSPLRFVLTALRSHRSALLVALAWSFAFVLIPMQVPLLTGYLVSGITGQGAVFFGLVSVPDAGTVLGLSALGLAAVAVGYGISAYLSTASVAELSRRFVADLRKSMIHKLDTSSLEVHERFGSGELLNRVIVDTQSTREFVETVFFNTIENVLRVAYPVALLFLLNPTIALIAAAFLPVQYVVTRHLQERLRTATRVARATQGRLTSAVKENLDGIETIQSSNAEGIAIRRVWSESDALADDQIAARTYAGLITGSTWAITSVGLALTWWIGGLEVLGGTLGLGTLVAITGYVVLLYTPMQRFTTVASVYQKGLVALERIHEVLAAPSAIFEDPKAPPLAAGPGRVELREVWFGYRGHPVLRGVTLVFRPGELTLLLGPNGSGKSTVLKLLSRLRDPSAGTVLIDGQDVRHVRLSSLRAQVAVVSQTTTMFSGSIRENLRLGRPDATDADLTAALDQAGALDFVRRLPHGLATQVGPGRAGLSGGEAQRLAIARALLRRPRILLLDEPNSALDGASEETLGRTLASLRQRITVIVIAHHAGTLLRRADHAIRLDEGRTVGAEAVAQGHRPHRTPPATAISALGGEVSA